MFKKRYKNYCGCNKNREIAEIGILFLLAKKKPAFLGAGYQALVLCNN